jgi:hypothetical protein
MIHFDDTNAADLELSRDARRGRSEQPGAVATDQGLVVADQREPAVEQAKREVGLARARRPGDQHRAIGERDRARVECFGGEA